MSDTTTQNIGIPIGANKSLVTGTLRTNKNGDAEWYQTGASLPTFTSNKSNNYQWQPSPNCVDFLGSVTCPTSEQRTNFYATTASITSLNNGRLETFKSPTGLNSPELARQLNIPGAINTAPDPGSPTPGSTSTLKDLKTEELNKGIDSREGAIKQHGDYKYPSEMPDDMDRIKFNMYTYGIRKTNPNFAGLNEKREPGELKGSVTLGIQPRISDRNSVSWNDFSANAVELAAAGASVDIISGGANAISTVLSKLGSSFNAEKSNIQEYAKTYFAGQAAGITGLTSRIGGVILNPNLELLFEGPQLRPFDFTFQLTPRDAPEATQVKQIIRFFKQGMAVQRTVTELFLKAPNIFEIAYQYKTIDRKTGAITTKLHPGLNQIKRCALMSCNVDYTPTGSYMTFSDGTMTAYSITLSFKELEPVYSDQYQNPEKDNEQEIEIGF